jgi:spermidine/putrescine transport system permease protein
MAISRALLLAALNSFDDFVRSFFIGGHNATLPVLTFGRWRSGLTPEMNALATLALIATLAAGGIIARYAEDRHR